MKIQKVSSIPKLNKKAHKWHKLRKSIVKMKVGETIKIMFSSYKEANLARGSARGMLYKYQKWSIKTSVQEENNQSALYIEKIKYDCFVTKKERRLLK